MDIINQFHKQHRKEERIRNKLYRSPIPHIECNDGFHISVQASEFAYCMPRVTDDIEYDEFECGYPSAAVPELHKWKDGGDDTDDTGTVYGYVPVAVLVALVEKHGGIKGALKHAEAE
jgi:hypothetical protein